MGGCFGNSPFDRSMENQLFRYLDSEDDGMCESCVFSAIKENTKRYENVCKETIDTDNFPCKNWREIRRKRYGL